MRVAFVLFDGLTTLDFVGIYDPVTRLQSMGFVPDLTWELCARTPEVRDDKGLRLTPTETGSTLAGYDLLIAPGGFGTRPLKDDPAFVDWLRSGEAVPLKASVCTGALLFGAAGFLRGRRATTHPNAYDLLRPYCAEVVTDARVVDEGPVITARGVTAAIDLGLHLVGRIAGAEAAAQARRQMDYPYGT